MSRWGHARLLNLGVSTEPAWVSLDPQPYLPAEAIVRNVCIMSLERIIMFYSINFHLSQVNSASMFFRLLIVSI